MSADNVIRMMCPNLKCRATLSVPAEARGRLIRCRSCGSTIQVPQKAPAKAKAPAANKGAA
jgi:DNA-directed RNA polymerase subunit RPC12/RpoP